MKLLSEALAATHYTVAPFVGAWIEIFVTRFASDSLSVAPFVGAWIEIIVLVRIPEVQVSLPSWERGLKSDTGALLYTALPGRSLRGSVD